MKNTNRNSLMGLLTLSAVLAMPAAFAQEQATDAAATQQTEQATGAAEQSAQQSTQSASQGKQGWADIDVDADGSISKSEATVNASLTQVFDQADGNADGMLTAEEYKAFVDNNQNQPQQ